MGRLCNQIIEVPLSRLCTGCGTCVGVCPTSALSLQKSRDGLYVPVLDDEKCTNCSLCLEVCPGHSVHFKELNKSIFGNLPHNPMVGNFLNSYVAYSSNSKLRLNGQSGGIVSSLLIFALEEGLVDGAIVVRMSKKNPLLPEVFIAKNRREVAEAMKSKYCPVPINSILQKVLAERGRYAIVGIPCQIHGIRKAERKNENLKRSIVLHFGLFCDRALNFFFQDYILSKICAERRDVQEFVYRSKKWRGWPGDMLIKLKNGRTKNLSSDWRICSKSIFTIPRCFTCFDKLNEFADVSFGDNWSLKHRSPKGTSTLISRTKVGDDIVNRAIENGIIKAHKISVEEVIETQKLRTRKLMLNSYFKGARLIGMEVPKYDLSYLKPLDDSVIGNIIAYFDYLLCNIPLNAFGFKLLKNMPLTVLKTFAFLRRRILSFTVKNGNILREECLTPLSVPPL